MTAIEPNLVFLGEDKIILANPSTFEYQEKKILGAKPNTKFYSTTVVGKDIETFGGWDERRQMNEVHVLDSKTGEWYKPHVSGCVPRPRNHHSAVVVHATRGFSEDEDEAIVEVGNAPDLARQKQQSASKMYIAHMFGWVCHDSFIINPWVSRPNMLTQLDSERPQFYGRCGLLVSEYARAR
jgi:hypothetical protein